MSVLFAITLSYGLQQNQSSKALDTLLCQINQKTRINVPIGVDCLMMNLVQYIFDFNKSVDSTAQMTSTTEMTLLDVQTIANFTKEILLGVVALWGDCTFIPADLCWRSQKMMIGIIYREFDKLDPF